MKFKIKPIRDDNDYNASLEYLNTIFDAEEGTPEADEKEVLSILIEKYENEHFTISKPSPVDAIKFRMEQEGLNQKDLIPYIGSRSKVSEILSGKRSLTLKMIRALNRHLGIPAEVLLQEHTDADLNDFSDVDFEKFPLGEMEKYGAFDGSRIENVKDQAEEAIRYVIEKIGGVNAIPVTLFRKTGSPRLNAKVDLYALYGWCLSVFSKIAEKQNAKKYDKNKLNSKFIKNLVSLSVFKDGPCLAQEFLYNHGIFLEIIPHFKKTYLDGASFITNAGEPVIALTLRYDRIDNFWFTLLHEIAHIKKHLKNGNYIIDDMSLQGSKDDDEKESEADNFAESSLLPKNFDLYENSNLLKDDVINYAEINNIHPAIVAGRIQYELNNYRVFSNLVGRGEVVKCFRNK